MSSSTTAPDASYTAMDKDVEAIGAHCEFAYCHQLDFLPFRCDSCHHTFCLDHRTETAHRCTHAGEWAKNRRLNSVGRTTTTTTAAASQGKPSLTNATQCSEPACKTFVNTSQNLGVHCQQCNRTYCLKHRMGEDHDCKNLIPLGARPLDLALQSNKDKIKLGFGRLKSWGKERQEALTPKPKPSSKAAQLASLNALKKSAKGDDKLPAEKRVYLHVEAEAASTTAKLPKADLFFSSDWSIGRMLDEAARRLQVANVNNRVETEEQRLRMYFVEGGRLLEFSEKVGSALASGNTVVLLRGVGPKQPK
ncbi:AN1-like Zinc finger family protein [Cladophialophora carrionii]|uniref:AN1-like Zinc finger family protein n=1 Tax=Cladophialophora carrionii TaxID=86049 RepID=A0A1C1CRY3_9EURO|nr:AN1-like Zinc finger family protein [Cladophialophora carrionii]